MTPQQLYAAIDAVRQEKDWPWWKVSIALDVSAERIRFMQRGVLSPQLRERAEKWLEKS